MKALKTLALVSLSTLGMATVQADEPIQTTPQTVTQGQYVETTRSPRLFGKKYRSEIVQTSGTMQQTTPSTTTQPSTFGGTTTTSTPVMEQPVQRRGLFGKLRSRRYSSTMTTTSTVTPSTSTSSSSSSDAKPLPLGK